MVRELMRGARGALRRSDPLVHRARGSAVVGRRDDRSARAARPAPRAREAARDRTVAPRGGRRPVDHPLNRVMRSLVARAGARRDAGSTGSACRRRSASSSCGSRPRVPAGARRRWSTDHRRHAAVHGVGARRARRPRDDRRARRHAGSSTVSIDEVAAHRPDEREAADRHAARSAVGRRSSACSRRRASIGAEFSTEPRRGGARAPGRGRSTSVCDALARRALFLRREGARSGPTARPARYGVTHGARPGGLRRAQRTGAPPALAPLDRRAARRGVRRARRRGRARARVALRPGRRHRSRGEVLRARGRAHGAAVREQRRASSVHVRAGAAAADAGDGRARRARAADLPRDGTVGAPGPVRARARSARAVRAHGHAGAAARRRAADLRGADQPQRPSLDAGELPPRPRDLRSSSTRSHRPRSSIPISSASAPRPGC